jgi:leucyl-tRNA synthetase
MSFTKTVEPRYPFAKIEKKWQEQWSASKIYAIDDDDAKPKWYELTMYPYPSGDLHVGHWYAMTGADIRARFMSMQGYNVLHPMGFDAFGLPAENAAIQRGIHPHKWTIANIERMRKQLASMGPMYDWNREIVTCLPEYYKWNQWFFLQLYKKGLAYRDFAPVNWCSECNTVLANEQVIDGICERCESSVQQRSMNQWFFKITQYAEELLDNSKIDWPERVTTMQTNWIGRSEGVEYHFDISEHGIEENKISTFTTRIDTVFGVTFVVMAPEHPLVKKLTTKSQQNVVQEYVNNSRKASDIERLSTEREKTGEFLGSFCVNKINGEKIPILIGDYVLNTYGTGIVMGVPAHDTRDFEFAKRYNLPIKVVIAPDNWNGSELTEAFTSNGTQINSKQFDGLTNTESKTKIAEFVEDNKMGTRTVNYRMRDWLISRQRYWGTPIPIIYCQSCGTKETPEIITVPDESLPVLLPEDADFLPTGESPLKLNTDFYQVNCPVCEQPATRETDTMDTFVDSSWYFLRFASPKYSEGPFDKKLTNTWNPVNQYTGGVEHAVMHLLYARFFVKATRDLGLIDFDEPFERLFNQGTIIYKGAKMSKSKGNVISPDDYVEAVGADTVRTYLMFIGPWDQGGEWNDSGINGAARWLNRVWDISELSENEFSEHGDNLSDRVIEKLRNKTIKKVGEDIEKFKYNTAISCLMEYTNSLSEVSRSKTISKTIWIRAKKSLYLMMAPITPHMAEELWDKSGNSYSVHKQPWPNYNDDLISDDQVTLIVQVNGKLRDKLEIRFDMDEESATNLAINSIKVAPLLLDKEIIKTIFVPSKLINIVVS